MKFTDYTEFKTVAESHPFGFVEVVTEQVVGAYVFHEIVGIFRMDINEGFIRDNGSCPQAINIELFVSAFKAARPIPNGTSSDVVTNHIRNEVIDTVARELASRLYFEPDFFVKLTKV